MWDGGDGKMAAALVQMSCLYRGMLAVRATGIRTLIPGLVPPQFRTFSVRKEPELEENPYYSKYQDKIRRLRSTKPQEYKARLEKRHEVKKEVLEDSKQAEFVRLMEQELEKTDKMAASDGGFTRNKTLGSILNLDLIQDKAGEEVAELWMRYYSTKDTISAVIPTQTYEVILGRSRSCPMFLYALPQKEGYEFFLGQWSGHELHFTSLINVQTLGDNAPSQLILYHYPDLKEKGVVLMTAEMDPKFITVHQAQCLANQVQLFYGTQRQETYRLVEMFNHHPADFKHMSVIAELEQSGLGSAVAPGGS
ncbi:ATP synthase mitochondrial F1 complex assembly factor 1 [Mastacembelus armatus]|uniref:ATP synthase mitochondrial F1 complex assembly factor 1 n=1 Tax=Mastacembelus armatus TaxID=205130 RepID=A0A3Q3MA16_9TELE|nr:ATP synthase mitochondrial F1 complex assembly factor 1 [Mastacembelus armatus]XP_026179086.1 ATP synthase mitochondrial F1 complex assembly factor 1 [Mastacembelus armatus]XP_026179087.1 ATP synthase mitochondrial F1 complex assembly factor 1 [Mastacembelus armatus]